MSLATHGAIGAIVASKFPGHPILAFCLAFASHFILDMFPHWDYPMRSVHRDESNLLNNSMPIGDKNFMTDIFKTGIDFSIGLGASLFLLSSFNDVEILKLTLIGVIGGVLPDFLQFIYMAIKKEPMISLQRFHHWIHTKNKMKNQPVLSVVSQAVLVLVVFYFGNI